MLLERIEHYKNVSIYSLAAKWEVSILEVLGNIILIISLLGVLVFGYFLMARIDKFLNENYSVIEKENEKKESSYVMLTEERSEEGL